MNLAMVQSTLGQHRDAEANLDRSLAIARRAYGEQHPHVADILNNTAVVFTRGDRLAEAAEVYNHALRIREF